MSNELLKRELLIRDFVKLEVSKIEVGTKITHESYTKRLINKDTEQFQEVRVDFQKIGKGRIIISILKRSEHNKIFTYMQNPIDSYVCYDVEAKDVITLIRSKYKEADGECMQ